MPHEDHFSHLPTKETPEQTPQGHEAEEPSHSQADDAPERAQVLHQRDERQNEKHQGEQPTRQAVAKKKATYGRPMTVVRIRSGRAPEKPAQLRLQISPGPLLEIG